MNKEELVQQLHNAQVEVARQAPPIGEGATTVKVDLAKAMETPRERIKPCLPEGYRYPQKYEFGTRTEGLSAECVAVGEHINEQKFKATPIEEKVESLTAQVAMLSQRVADLTVFVAKINHNNNKKETE